MGTPPDSKKNNSSGDFSGDLVIEVPFNITITRQDILEALAKWPTLIDSTPEELIEIFRLALENAKRRNRDEAIVSQVMTKSVIYLKPTTTIGEAARIMTSRNVHGCPVVDEEMRVIGIVTESNIAFLAGGTKSPRLRDWFSVIFGDQKPAEINWNEKVSRIMSHPVITVFPDTPVKEALTLMQDKRIKTAPVVDENNKLVGILSLHDILHQFSTTCR
ncbi:MAG: hypothetical protein DRG59_04775 [Deltaproteobacteria bacterium]|nr:MAG: hypothetical protein DRG59_04775 [Deltaproteobacteria bacterium]